MRSFLLWIVTFLEHQLSESNGFFRVKFPQKQKFTLVFTRQMRKIISCTCVKINSLVCFSDRKKDKNQKAAVVSVQHCSHINVFTLDKDKIISVVATCLLAKMHRCDHHCTELWKHKKRGANVQKKTCSLSFQRLQMFLAELLLCQEYFIWCYSTAPSDWSAARMIQQ